MIQGQTPQPPFTCWHQTEVCNVRQSTPPQTRGQDYDLVGLPSKPNEYSLINLTTVSCSILWMTNTLHKQLPGTFTKDVTKGSSWKYMHTIQPIISLYLCIRILFYEYTCYSKSLCNVYHVCNAFSFMNLFYYTYMLLEDINFYSTSCPSEP